MKISEAVRIFFSGEKLIFGYYRHIEVRDLLRSLKKRTKDYSEYEHFRKQYLKLF